MKFAVGYQLSEENEELFVEIIKERFSNSSQVYERKQNLKGGVI